MKLESTRQRQKTGRKGYVTICPYHVFIAQKLNKEGRHSLRQIASLMANVRMGTKVDLVETRRGEKIFVTKAYGPTAIRKMLTIQLSPKHIAQYENAWSAFVMRATKRPSLFARLETKM